MVAIRIMPQSQPERTIDKASAMARIWITPLGNAWKVRMSSHDAAESLRDRLQDQGLKCTMLTPSFSDASMTLFRVVGPDQRHRVDLEEALRHDQSLELMADPA